MDFKVVGKVDINRIKEELSNKKVSSQFPLQAGPESAVGTNYELRNDEQYYNQFIYNDMPYTKSVVEQFNLTRARIMKMVKGTAYGIHVDNTPRIHIPLESNENCIFIIDDIVHRMPADGSVYWVNTTKPHTAVNANTERFIRTHLMGNVTV